MSIRLTDAEYKALLMEATQRGKPVESLLHEVLTQHIKPSRKQKLSPREIEEYLFREGIIERIAIEEPETPEEEAERAYLASLFGQGKPVSDMVIEDRGPR
ncbi:MAG TPA: hypothetical protein VNE61_06005 [Ktedonobacteraceae bacterium]|nr:hypothetical protein [Ktedonobacteraceae bacterium]